MLYFFLSSLLTRTYPHSETATAEYVPEVTANFKYYVGKSFFDVVSAYAFNYRA